MNQYGYEEDYQSHYRDADPAAKVLAIILGAMLVIAWIVAALQLLGVVDIFSSTGRFMEW